MLDTVPIMVLATAAIILGIAGLVWSADRFVAGAASIAESFGIAPVIVGLTIVSFGTSAPEVMVSVMASLDGSGDLAVGNALGSNIANVGLVLGVTLLIMRIPVATSLLRYEGSLLIAVTLLAGVFLYDAYVSTLEGWILLLLLAPLMWYLTRVKQREHSAKELVDELSEDIPHYSPKAAMLWFIVGLAALIASSKVLVWGAEITAQHFGVSPLIIGLSVIAIGTSLPELAASIMSAIRGHHDIALGNIVGSNIFNILAVMSMPGILGSSHMGAEVFSRDYVAMLGMTLILFVFMGVALLKRRQDAKLGKLCGVLLLLLYTGYMALIAQSQFSA